VSECSQIFLYASKKKDEIEKIAQLDE